MAGYEDIMINEGPTRSVANDVIPEDPGPEPIYNESDPRRQRTGLRVSLVEKDEYRAGLRAVHAIRWASGVPRENLRIKKLESSIPEDVS